MKEERKHVKTKSTSFTSPDQEQNHEFVTVFITAAALCSRVLVAAKDSPFLHTALKPSSERALEIHFELE